MLDLEVTGGYGDFTYAWNTPDGHIEDPSSLDQSSLSAGSYTIRATDAISCFRQWAFKMNEPDTLSVNPVLSDYNSYNISCFNSSDGTITLNPSGGVGPYNYYWTETGSGFMNTNEDQEMLSAGEFNVKLTDNNNCLITHHFNLNQPDAIETSIVPATIKCFGMNTGSADLTVTGGISPYDYTWSNGADTQDIDSLFMGEYVVTITDQNNCQKEDTTTITEAPEILINLDAPGQYNGRMITCFGRSDADILSNVSGGVGTFRYNWLPGGQTTRDISNVPAGQYVLSVTDDNECTVYDSIEVVQPQPLETEIYATDPTCHGAADGQVTLIPQGGTPDYSITWGGLAKTGQTVDSIRAGYYRINIEDLNACRLDTIVRVNEPDSLYITAGLTNPDCPDKANGSIRLDPHGGTAPYSYTWSDDNYGNYVEDLKPGVYVVYLTDNNQCVVSDSLVLESMNASCLRIPTAFTPNGDGFNDTWEIEDIQLYPETVVEIYNRWGELIYRSDKGYDNPWDGTYRGRDLPIDSYHFVIDLGEGHEPITGHVTIIK